MSLRALGVVVISTLLQLIAFAAPAQTYNYHVYIDSDLRNTTGCTVSGGGQSFVGADYRLTATVTGSPPVVTARTLSSCVAGSFSAGNALPANYPVGLNNGLPLAGGAAADVIELSVARSQLPGVESQVRIGIGADSASGSTDVLYTADGTGNGLPMVIGSPALIPTLGFFGGLLLAVALAVLALRSLKQNRLMAQMLLLGAFVSVGFAAWAANHIADGQVGDWASDAPIGMDAIGDSVPPLSGTDIVGAFGADERPNLHFRIDVVDAENRPPVAVDDSYGTLEDTVLNIAAPGVLGNDSDPDGDPITAQLVTGPTRGTLTLNANGSFTYTPNANLNGPDSFTYNAFDGQVVGATPATVSINVTPVNDAPVFAAGANQSVLEDAGPQTVSPWATGVDDGDPEVVQNLSFNITGNTNAALFSAGPAVSASGVLSYTPAANANGVATITLNLMDDGGTANGGVDTSAAQSFTITVAAVNDAPSFTAGPSQTVLEDAGAQTVVAWATAISAGPPDESGQAVSFEITANDNAALFSAAPAVSPAGDLTYTPAANANGVATISVRARDDGGTANGGIDVSAAQTFTITVTSVNDVPAFTAGPNQTVLEDAGAQTVTPWATGIDDGDPEIAQALTFNITGNTNPALFSAGPTVDAAGALSYTPAADANGVATITLNLMDDGGTANGGIDISAPQSFTITITAVNDAPSFTAVDPPAVLEDAAPVSIPAWAAFTAGPPDEAGQTVLAYQVSAISNAGLFAVAPTVAANGTLSYTVAANANGSSTFAVNVQDDGGTANGGVDTSAAQTFTINVTAVNDQPSFLAGPAVIVNEDAGAQSQPWATGISAGPPDEAGQSLSFNIVSNDNAALFSAQPSVSATGVLSFTPAANANGVANIALNLMDNGGTANGGVDTSGNQSFTITVSAVNDPPVNTVPVAQSVDEDAALAFTGPALISVSDLDIAAGALSVDLSVSNGTVNVVAAGAASVTNNGTAAVQVSGALADVNATLASLSYTPTANYAGADSLSVSSNDNGNTGSGGPLTDLDAVAISVNPINDAPVNSVPGVQTVSGGLLIFSTANTNTITVADVDANPGNVQVDLSVTAGSLNAVGTPGVVITGNNTAAVTLVGLQANVNTAMDGLGYVPSGGGTDTLTVLTSDLGNTGAGGQLTDTDTVTLLIDAAPSVTAVAPANAATQQANNVNVVIDFSESVNAAAGAVVVMCAPSGANAASGALAGVTQITLTGAAIGAANGDVCGVLVTAALVNDVDAIDPPDFMAADFTSTYTIDVPPAFVASVPADGAIVANDASFAATFSEPVNFGMGGFTLNCGAPIAVTPSGSGTSTLTFTPAAALPDGASCTATLFAANITDVDAGDPPDNLPADVVINFSVDAAPQITGGAPGNLAAQVATDTTVSFIFTESVDDLGGAITLDCGGAISGAISGSGSNTLVFTPSAALPENTSCTATAVAAQIADSDSIDPPNNPAANVVRTFATDAAPTVLNTLPATGALLQPPTGTITINFSEIVDFSTVANAANTSFDLECPVATPANFTVVTASPASSVVLDPDDLAIAGQTCVLTIRAAGITDSDGGDPPDNLPADVVVTIGYDDPAIANDDTYNVNPHLLLAIDTGVQGGRVLANDTVGSATITGFGPIGTCAAAVPNGSNFITTVGGGRVVLNLNGSFSYAPPAGLVGNGMPASPEDGFCYTLTGGDTANVSFELANTELVWFADVAYAGANGPADGTQARPHTNLPAIAAVDTANDIIHVAANASSYTGIQLEANQRLIGAGSASDLVTITGIAPVAGSAFPALGGTRPTIAGSGINLASNNVIRGLNIGDTGGTDGLVAGAPFGTLTMSEASILGTGRAMNFSAAGTLNVVLDELSSSGGFNGVLISGVGGTITVGAGGTNIGGTVGGDAIFVQLAPAGTNFNFGATTITSALGGVTSNANNAGAVISFTSLAITTPTGPGLVANSGTINIGGVSNTIVSSGGPALSIGSTNTGAGWTFSTLSSSNSPSNGIILDSVTGGGITGNGGSISGSTGTAFQALNGLGGGVSYAGNISKASAGRLVDISGAGSGNVTLAGNLSCTAACGTGAGSHGLRVNGRTGGTISFSGGTKTFSSSAANPGVSLTGNTGATINFSGGGLAVASTTGNAFEASGGGTVGVTGAGNTLSNTTGIALNVLNTTISGVGLTFQSISSNGGVNGITLNGTGASGGLTVTGTGSTAGSGGTIQNKTGDGIRLDNTRSVTLNFVNLTNTASTGSPSNTCGTHPMTGIQDNTTCTAAIDMQTVLNVTLNGLNISGGQQYGINGNAVAGFSLTGSTISGSGDQVEEDGIRFINLTGSALIRNTTVQNSFSNNLRISNSVATALTLTIDETVANSSRFLAATGNDGVQIEGLGSSNIALNISGTDFDSSNGDHIQTVVDGSATMSMSIQNNTMTATNPGVLGSGITLSSSGAFNGSKTFNISNNTINGAKAEAINVNLGTTTLNGGTGTYSGTISGNVIGTTGVLDSGGGGIAMRGNGGGTITALVTGNTVRQFNSNAGITVLQRDGSGTINATVTNNTVAEPVAGGFNGVSVQAGATSGPPIDNGTVCLEFSGNSTAGSGAGGGSATDFRLRQRFNTTFRVRGYTGLAGDTVALVAYLQGINPGGETGSATVETTPPTGTGFINTAGGAACPQP